MTEVRSARNFDSWLRQQADRDDATGDIARDYIDATRRKVYRKVSGPGGLLKITRHRHSDVHAAAESAVAEYREWLIGFNPTRRSEPDTQDYICPTTGSPA